ncbi:MAG: helix-turn-helix domain-containing protein [Achromobacter pestifer]
MNAPDSFVRQNPALDPVRHLPLPDLGNAPVSATSDHIDGWWNLLYLGWTLVTPSGVRVDLTATERACFLCMLQNPGRELLRDDLLVLRSRTNMRSLNLAICRLRHKVLQTGTRLPLHTVHGAGYVFLGNLREIPHR